MGSGDGVADMSANRGEQVADADVEPRPHQVQQLLLGSCEIYQGGHRKVVVHNLRITRKHLRTLARSATVLDGPLRPQGSRTFPLVRKWRPRRLHPAGPFYRWGLPRPARAGEPAPPRHAPPVARPAAQRGARAGCRTAMDALAVGGRAAVHLAPWPVNQRRPSLASSPRTKSPRTRKHGLAANRFTPSSRDGCSGWTT